jgi:hypothetical protein
MSDSFLRAKPYARRALDAMHRWACGPRNIVAPKLGGQCAAAIALLEGGTPPDAPASDRAIKLVASWPLVQSGPNEEWYEISRFCELTLHPGELVFAAYTNLATMVGASQSEKLQWATTQPMSDADEKALDGWATSVVDALAREEAHGMVSAASPAARR